MTNSTGKLNAGRLAFLQEQKPIERKEVNVSNTDVKTKLATLKIDPSKLMPGAAAPKFTKAEQTNVPEKIETTTATSSDTTSEKTEETVNAKLKHLTLERPKRPGTIRERKQESKPLPEFNPSSEIQETKPAETKATTEEPQVEEKREEKKEEEIIHETPTLALTQPSIVSTEPQKLTKTTCILVNFNPELGRLFVRGNGPGMSWSSGVEILPKEGKFKLEFDSEGDFEYKFLLNDQSWENVHGNINHKAISGNTETVHPQF